MPQSEEDSHNQDSQPRSNKGRQIKEFSVFVNLLLMDSMYLRVAEFCIIADRVTNLSRMEWWGWGDRFIK